MSEPDDKVHFGPEGAGESLRVTFRHAEEAFPPIRGWVPGRRIVSETKPALSVEQWAAEWAPDNCRALDLGARATFPDGLSVHGYFSGDRLSGLIALANDARPDDDPGKITRAMVADLRAAYHDGVVLARHYQDAGMEANRIACRDRAARLSAYADALESILPPEGT